MSVYKLHNLQRLLLVTNARKTPRRYDMKIRSSIKQTTKQLSKTNNSIHNHLIYNNDNNEHGNSRLLLSHNKF